jgi:hypothetical protein
MLVESSAASRKEPSDHTIQEWERFSSENP